MACDGADLGSAVDVERTGPSVVAIVEDGVHQRRLSSAGDDGRCSPAIGDVYSPEDGESGGSGGTKDDGRRTAGGVAGKSGGAGERDESRTARDELRTVARAIEDERGVNRTEGDAPRYARGGCPTDYNGDGCTTSWGR